MQLTLPLSLVSSVTRQYSLAITFESIGGCKEPTQPGNGTIIGYSSRENGAVVMFRCNTGYIPQMPLRVVCQNGSWTPNPADLTCRGLL